jgi:hypothetical protein
MLKIVGTLNQISVVNGKGILHISKVKKLNEFMEMTELEEIEVSIKKISKYKNKINKTISIDVAHKLIYIGI